MSRADIWDDYAVREAVEAQACIPDPDSIASSVIEEGLLEWERGLDQVDAIFKEEFGMTTDEVWKQVRDADAKRRRRQ
jgi:hypothetical protein